MEKLFGQLEVWIDPVARDGAAQMAIDEALLEIATGPVLRQFRWDGPWVSFGYSQSAGAVFQEWPGIPAVRRWTGGGIVPHLGDGTFALIVPRSDPFAEVRPAESYRLIHESLAACLAGSGVTSRLAGGGDLRAGAACFVSPAAHDVLTPEGEKLAGGAQRRNRRGFLHQGSIQNTAVPADFASVLGDYLSKQTANFTAGENLERTAAHLRATKYATREWTEKVP